jgi:hypothetical protein
MAERVHAIIKASAPDLSPRLWYGMRLREGERRRVLLPARAEVHGEVLHARLQRHDEGAMWPASYALTELTAAAGARLGELVKRVAG